MLILTRRIGESVYIGDEVHLTVLGVRGTQVRIGINAPKDIPVHREEIYHKIRHAQTGETPPYDNAGNQQDYKSERSHAQPQTGKPEESERPAEHDDAQQPSPEEADPNNS